MSKPRPANRLIITLPSEVLDRLRARGARSDKNHGPYNYTSQLTRALSLYESVVFRSDPRETVGLAEPQYDLILDLLRRPYTLEAFHVHCLAEYLLDMPDFENHVRDLGLEPGEFATTLRGLTFAEKLHLVDQAQIRHAPRPRKSRDR